MSKLLLLDVFMADMVPYMLFHSTLCTLIFSSTKALVLPLEKELNR